MTRPVVPPDASVAPSSYGLGRVELSARFLREDGEPLWTTEIAVHGDEWIAAVPLGASLLALGFRMADALAEHDPAAGAALRGLVETAGAPRPGEA